jgi:prevent-host-death family protein
MKSSIQAAKSHLSQLVKAASSGEEVVITKNGSPIVKLVRIDGPSSGRFDDSPLDLFKPMTRDELARWEGQD